MARKTARRRVSRRRPARRNRASARPRRRRRRNVWHVKSTKGARWTKYGKKAKASSWAKRIKPRTAKNRPRRRRRRNMMAPGLQMSVPNRGYARNSILPFPTVFNPTKRRRKSRRNARRPKRRSRARSRARRNSILPYPTVFNAGNPMATLQAHASELTNVNFWTREILPLAGGFLGTGFVAAQIRSFTGLADTGIVKHLTNIGSALVLSSATALIAKDKAMTTRVFAGGLVYAVYGILHDLIGGTEVGKALGLGGLGNSLSPDLKNRIARSVAHEVDAYGGGGVSDFLTSQSLRADTDYLSDFATAQGIDSAPHEGGMPAPVMELEDVIHASSDAALI